MKKTIWIMVVLLMLSGCRKSDTLLEQDDRSSYIEKQTGSSNEGNDDKSKASSGIKEDETEIETSYVIQGEPFRKSVFTAGSDGVYLCGIDTIGQYFLGHVLNEEQQLRRFSCKIPDGMRVVSIVCDHTGNAHVLLMSTSKTEINGEVLDQLDYKRTEIWNIKSNGDIEEVKDVSKPLSGKINGIPRTFYVDPDGTYYLDAGGDIIILDKDGITTSYHTMGQRVTALGQGKSGKVYVTYFGEDGIERLTCMDWMDSGIELTGMEIATSKLSAGKENELLLYNKAGGVYALADVESKEIHQLTGASTFPVSGDDVVGCDLMKDGRLCLLEVDDVKSIIHIICIER